MSREVSITVNEMRLKEAVDVLIEQLTQARDDAPWDWDAISTLASSISEISYAVLDGKR